MTQSAAPVSESDAWQTRWLWLALALLVIALGIWFFATVELAPARVNTRARLLPPFSVLQDGSLAIFGTDQIGRDVFRQVIEGAQTSLFIALSAALISAAFGAVLGVAAGWIGGRFDSFMMRIVDVQLSFPSILIAVFLAAFLTPSLISVILVLAITRWAMITRLSRAITVRARKQGYVEAALVSGFPLWKVLSTCVAPNLYAPLLVVITAEVSELILAEAALSFLGIGTPSDVTSWGRIISQGRNYLDTAWWIATLPGLAIAVVVIGIGLASEVLRRRLTKAGWTML
ncbi:ABC transporter permease [Chelativorans sp. J32]|uniref:ABC transporter permease n=1 Tax=Chelativorans sp. J32 TaxID=935840 RepID=UPI0004B8E24B|nr:ABC transporter permease [Chelativorans sp. J32]